MPDLAQILTLLRQLAYAFAQQIPGFTAIENVLNQGNPNSPWNIQKNLITTTVSDLENVTYGLSALHAQITDVQTAIVALGSPVQVGDPVTLPGSPPTGYGGGASVTDVWNYVYGDGETSQGSYLLNAGQFPNQLQNMHAQFPMHLWPGWSVGGGWGYIGGFLPNGDYLTAFDPATILITDTTVFGWLDREYPAHGCTPDSVGRPEIYETGSNFFWTYYIGTTEFAEYKAAKFGAPPPALNAPPVWPGYSGVTYVGVFTLVDGLFIDQPMEGMSVVISSAPPGSAQFVFGAAVSYRYLGAVTFETDSQDRETPQNLGFDQAIYLPKSMAHSTGARFRVRPGVTGAVYPFTIP
jgi:hypothetical protein